MDDICTCKHPDLVPEHNICIACSKPFIRSVMMKAAKCSIVVYAGFIPQEADVKFTRKRHFTEEDLSNPPTYIDGSGAALNYAMSLMNPQRVNWVKLAWVWY